MNQTRQLYPRIESDPEIGRGQPVIAGTRMSVEIILERLADGRSVEELLDSYPFLAREDISAALGYAAHLVATLALHEEQAAS